MNNFPASSSLNSTGYDQMWKAPFIFWDDNFISRVWWWRFLPPTPTPTLNIMISEYQRVQVVVLIAAAMRKLTAIAWLSALNGRLWNYFSSYHCHLIRPYSRVALCIRPSFFNLSPSLSFSFFFKSVSAPTVPASSFFALERFPERKKKTRDSVCTHSLAAPTAIPFGLSETWTGESINRVKMAWRGLKHVQWIILIATCSYNFFFSNCMKINQA